MPPANPSLSLDSDTTLQNAALAKHDDLEDHIIDSLSTCDKKWYYIFGQEHVGAEDMRSGAMSKMAESVGKADKNVVVEVPGVVGVLDGERVKERLTEACERMGRKAVDCEWKEADELQGQRLIAWCSMARG